MRILIRVLFIGGLVSPVPGAAESRPYYQVVTTSTITGASTISQPIYLQGTSATGHQPDDRIGFTFTMGAVGRALPPASTTFTLAAIGDVMLSHRFDGPIRDGVQPFRDLAPVLRGADLAIANLEGPITNRGTRVRPKTFTFRVPPARTAMLVDAGLDVLALANNHSMDFGPVGLRDTIAALRGAGLAWCGAGETIADARRPAIVEVRGTRVAVLSYNWTLPTSFNAVDGRPPRASRPERKGDRGRPTRAGNAEGHPEWMAGDIAKARETCPVVIVMIHWGQEKSHALRAYQRPHARRALEAGAALVIGHHPHVAQGIERIGNGVACYSIGDGVFGGSDHRSADSLVLRAGFGPAGLAHVEVLALHTNLRAIGFVPRIRAGSDARPTLDLVRSLSAELGTTLAESTTAEGWPALRLDLIGAPSR